MEQDVSELVNRIRGEGVDGIIKLKRKYGCTKDNDGLILTQSKVQQSRKGKSFRCIMCKSLSGVLDRKKLFFFQIKQMN